MIRQDFAEVDPFPRCLWPLSVCRDAKLQIILLLWALILASFTLGYAFTHALLFAAYPMVPLIVVIHASFCRVARVEFGFQSHAWDQNLVEMFVCGPCILFLAVPWAFAYQIAWAYDLPRFPQIMAYVAVSGLAILAVGSRSLSTFGGFAALMRGFAPLLLGWAETPAYSPWLGALVGSFLFVPGFVRYRHDQALVAMVPAVMGTATSAGYYFGSKDIHATLLLLLSCFVVYLQVLLLRRRRVLPPALQGCKFIRLSYLRRVAESGEGLRRCQELPVDAFGDPTKARYLVVVSHRWMDRYTCDVRTKEFPEGLRLNTMLKKFDQFFSLSGIGKGRTWRERRWRFNFALTSGSDVLVFFDFMSLPQVGRDPDGTLIDRTPMETLIFQECLPSMGVLYSMFPVMVCDEVEEGAPPYLDSGWCFSECATAWLGQQLSLFSADSAVEKLLNERSAALEDLSEVGRVLDLLLVSKRFLFESDRQIARIMSGSFVLKSRLIDAINSKNIAELESSIRDIRAGRFESLLDQPLDSYLNTPLHIAVAANFAKGVSRLLDAGANKDLKNLRGDTPVQLFMFPRLSAAARLCRSKKGQVSKLPPGDTFRRLSRQYTWSTLGPPATSDADLRDLDGISRVSDTLTLGTLGDLSPRLKRRSIVSLDTESSNPDDDDDDNDSHPFRGITPTTEDLGVVSVHVESMFEAFGACDEPELPMRSEGSFFQELSESPSSCN